MRFLLGCLCAAFGLALAPTAAADALPPPLAVSPTDSTLSPLWVRHLAALDARLAEAEAELDADRKADLVTATLRTARALAREPDVAASPTLRALVLRAHTAYEAVHGPVAPTALAPADLFALRGAGLADAVDYAGVPALPEVADGLPVTLKTISVALPPAIPHLTYPDDAADLVAAQGRVAYRFRNVRRRGTLRMIERTLRRRGLPTDLKYIAVIESALNPQAESHAGARGLWQFMPATANQFGLDSTSVTDPAKSTEAAARYLRQLHRRFRGDWQLALAAYNAGPGRVGAIVRRHQRETGVYPTFWDIHDALPRETQAYVPRFIAVAKLLGPAPARR